MSALKVEDWLVYFTPFAVFVGLGYAFYRLMIGKNPLEWWHFVSTRGEDGKSYADLDKLGKLVALIVSSVAVLWMAYQAKIDATLLGVYLTFAGAIAGWAAYLRSKRTNGNGNGHGVQPPKPKDKP